MGLWGTPKGGLQKITCDCFGRTMGGSVKNATRGALGSLGRPWAALGGLGQPWAALGSLGQPWAALGGLGQPWAALRQKRLLPPKPPLIKNFEKE